MDNILDKGKTLQERVLFAGMRLFLANGYSNTTTRDIAREAGTSESGVFRVYPSKYEVLMAVYDACWAKVNDVIDAALVDCDDNPRERIVMAVRTFWKMYEDKAQQATMTFVLINIGNTDTLLVERRDNARITPQNLRYAQRIHNLCNIAAERGLIPKKISGAALAEAVLGVAEGFLLGWYLADRGDSDYPRVSISDAVKILAYIVGDLPQEKYNGKHQISKRGRSARTAQRVQ